MNKIPIVFTFDDNYALPAAIAIKSLVYACKHDTWYEIYCLYNNLSEENRRRIEKIARIQWVKMNKSIFNNVFSTKEYPIDVYYRLIVHDILAQYNKIIYSDVDVLFHEDLSEVYNTDINDFYWAGVPLERNENPSFETISAQVGNPDDPNYMSGHTKFKENKNEFIFASGFMVINAEKMRRDKMTEKFLQTIKQFTGRLKMFDLEILNLACQNNTIKPLPFRYCVLEDIAIAKDYKKANTYPFLSRVFSDKELISGIINPVISHYTGANAIRVWNRNERTQPVPYKIFYDIVPTPFLKKHDSIESLFISKSDKILIIAPHPDDESIGCGGLLLKYAEQCDVVVLTDGRHGGLEGQNKEDVINIRKTEFEEVMSDVGVKNYRFLNIEDGKLDENFEKFSTLDVDLYDTIICPASNENNPDHACVYKFLLKLIPQVRILTYEVWSTLPNPTHYIDISDVIDKKTKLIQRYESQISQVDYISKIIGLNCYRGMQVYPAIQYAEVYQEM